MHTTLIQGASRGIGLAMVEARLKRGDRVFATCRDPGNAPALAGLVGASSGRLTVLRLDVTDETTILHVAERIREETAPLDWVVNVAGVLHGPGIRPEKRLGHLEMEALEHVFAVNAFGPIVVAKHLAPLLRRDRPAVFAALSARVGSIGDNRLGGWYAYRASKSALNQLMRTLSIELSRSHPHSIVASVHPGTVDTDLSSPFQRRVPADKLFSVERAAGQLIDVIEGLEPGDTGQFWAWDGSPIPW